MKAILTILLLFTITAYGQSTLPLGSSNTTVINKIAGSLQVDSTIKSQKYKSSDTGLIFFDASGNMTKVSKSSIVVAIDTSRPSGKYASKYYVDSLNSSNGTQYYGTIYNSNTWSALTGFTSNGCTASVSGGKIDFSGGANNNSQSLDYDYYSGLEHYKITGRFKVTEKSSTSYGFGVGVRSYTTNNPVSLNLKFDMSTGSNSGKILLYTGTNTTLRATSSTAVTFSVNDYITLSVERFHNKIVGTAYNATTGERVYVSYTFATNPPVYAPNRWKYAVFSVGGTFTLDSLNITSKELKYASWGIGGDSKVAGYRASTYTNSFYNLLKEQFADIFVSASGSDMTEDLVAKVPEIIALAPKQFIIAIGCNDLRFSVDTATMKANIDTVAARLTRANIDVYYLTPFPESSLDQSVLLNHILSKPSDKVINVWNELSACGSTCRVDAYHLNDSGQIIVYDKIMSSGLFKGANNILDYAVRQDEFVYPLAYTNNYPSTNAVTIDTANWHSVNYYNTVYAKFTDTTNFLHWPDTTNKLATDYDVSQKVSTTIYPFVKLNNAAFKRFIGTTSGSGDLDLYTCPAGKRAAIQTLYGTNTNASAAVIYAELKIGSTYYRLTTNSSSISTTTQYAQNVQYTLDGGESIAINATQSGVNITATIIEYDTAGSSLKSVKITNPSNGNNTLYTVPTGKTAFITASQNGIYLTGNNSFNVCTDATSTSYYFNLVPSGGSVATSNKIFPTTSLAANTRTQINMNVTMTAGDFINYNTATGSSGQIAWINVIEQ